MESTSKDNYITSDVIGYGGYSFVYTGYRVNKRVNVVIKAIKYNREIFEKNILTECMILQKLNHPGIIKLFDYYHIKDMFYLVMEKMDMSLIEVRKNGEVLIDKIKHILRSILKALVYSHSKSIVHHDLKPDNIMVKDDKVVIIDWGLSMEIKPAYKKYNNSMCTPLYCPPEAFLGDCALTGAFDMWSLGCIFIEIVQGSRFIKTKSIKNSLKRLSKSQCILNIIFSHLGTPPKSHYLTKLERWKNVYTQCEQRSLVFSRLDGFGNELLNKMIDLNPSTRITASEALAHPFFNV